MYKFSSDVKNRYPKRTKKNAVPIIPTILYFSPDLPYTLGNAESPQKRPAIDPPRLPDHDTLSEVRAIFIKMKSTTIKIRIHLTFSSSCETLNALQFTKTTARIPVKIPAMAVYAPML